ncbi:MAG: biopolymer transporter ExbD [Flavobacteriales bacterium]|nr:biopolymer transporter ExbD [Flavobacteriales bacterium]NNK81481.1 biopolymer transporter ExbD [Flavobacteriales bacterium]
MDLRSRNKVDPSFSMSSMTDLVFLLLIFFIILSTMVSPYALPVDLPNSSNKSKEKQTVALRIDADLIYSVGNRIIDQTNLESELKGALSVQDEKSIVLHVDKAVPTGQTVEVLDIAKRNRWKIVLATKPK